MNDDLDKSVGEAIKLFWKMRARQSKKQGSATGKKDAEQAIDFIPREHDGQAFGPLRPHSVQAWKLDLQHVVVEKQDRAQRLRLPTGCTATLHGQMCEKLLNLRLAHLLRVSLLLEKDKSPHPLHIGLFGAVGTVFRP